MLISLRLINIEYKIGYKPLDATTKSETLRSLSFKKMCLHFNVGESSFYKTEKHDDTHLSLLGATEISELVIAELKKTDLDLKKHIK